MGDAVVVGIPNERFGEEVVAVVEPAVGPNGPAAVDPTALIELREGEPRPLQGPAPGAGGRLVGRRAANGKVDYRRHRSEAAEWAAAAPAR